MARTIPTDKHICYHVQWRTCGYPKCRCHTGQKHGPYRYAYWYENGKLVSAYAGKVVEKQQEEEATHA